MKELIQAMLAIEKAKLVFHLERCTQCGVCLAACNREALSADLLPDGLWGITIDAMLCNRCGTCVTTCPAHRLPDTKPSEKDWDQLKEAVLAHAVDESIRIRASSGGVARALIQGALASGVVESAYTLRARPQYPWAEGAYWTAPFDPTKTPASLYLPIPVMMHVRSAKPQSNILLVGTTCQLLGARLLLKKVERIHTIALLCKQQKTFAFTRFLARRLGIEPDLDLSPCYRGSGWPGETVLGGRSIPYSRGAALPFGKRLWRVPGCRCCPNPLGIDVDLTLADPWDIEGCMGSGMTMVMVWSQQGQQLMESVPGLAVDRRLRLKEVKKSIAWSDIMARNSLVDYYAHQCVERRTRIAGWMERAQSSLYEHILEGYNIPEIASRVLARLPDLPTIILRGTLRSDKAG
jgi:coenzyme F420-reducing hydrogenase beta subunit